MKYTFRRLLTAALASAMTFCAAASLPQTAFSAYALEQVDEYIEFINALPGESEISELGSLSLTEDSYTQGFKYDRENNALSGAEVFYVYIPKTEGVDAASVRVSISHTMPQTDPDAPVRIASDEATLSARPHYGALIAKIDLNALAGKNIVSIGFAGDSFTPTAAGNGTEQDVFVYREVTHLPEDPIPAGDGEIGLPDQLPADGRLTEVKKFTFPIDKVQSYSIPVPLPDDPESFAGYYLYIPQQAGVGKVETDLELQIDSNNGGYLPWIRSTLDSPCIDAAPAVLKIASTKTMVRRIELTKHKAETLGENPAESFDVYFYIYHTKAAEPEQPEQPVKLEAAALPQNAEPISSVVRLEDAAKKTQFSLGDLTYHYLDAQYDGDFSRYPKKTADAEQWAEFSTHIELTFTRETVKEEKVVNDDGTQTVIPQKQQSQSKLGYGLPLLDGRSTKLIEPKDGKDPWSCTYMDAECVFDGMAFTKGNDIGTEIDMPAGIGSLNVSGADCIGDQPYRYFYLKLSHAAGQGGDASDYALLTFHVFRNSAEGKWEEFRTFTAGADMERAAGEDGTADAVVKMPNDLLKPDNGYLYIIEPKFFTRYSAEGQSGRQLVTEGTGYVTLFGANALCGDLNNDGTVSIADAVMMTKYLVTAEDNTENITAETADLNGDGRITAADLSLLKRLILTAHD